MTSYAIGLPNGGMFGNPALLVSLARDAEEAGWDGCFVWDHLLWRDDSEPVADPVVVAAAIAATTQRLTFGVLITNLARRRPGKVARELLTLDHLSGGRVVFGAGLGSLATEWSGFGEDPEPKVRAAKLDEGLEVVRALWSGEPVRYAGEHHRVDGVRMRPVPLREAGIPVWIGGSWPRRAPFLRAARYDGVMPTHVGYGSGTTMPPEDLAAVVEFVRANRLDDGPFDVVLEGATDGADDHPTVEPYVHVGLTWWIEALGPWRGDLGAVRARVAAGPPRAG